jgi:hypothetical protein
MRKTAVALFLSATFLVTPSFAQSTNGSTGLNVDVSLGGAKGANANVNAAVGRSGARADVDASVGGARGTNASAAASLGRGQGVNADVDATLGGGNGTNATAVVKLGGGNGASAAVKAPAQVTAD